MTSLPQFPLPLLITGIAGVAGYNAFLHLREKFPGQVVGLRRENNWPLRGDGIVGCDAHNHDRLARLFDLHQFAAVLNCEGNCALKSCELDPAMARRINVQSMEGLLDVVGASAVRIVHLSVDLVFSGAGSGGYVEQDVVDPVTIYGKTMVEAEQLILRARPDAAVLRLPLPMGVSFNGHAGAIDWIQSRFKQDKPATLYFDEIRSPVYTDCLNRMFERVLATDIGGLFHAGGPRRLSLYEIAQVINRVGGYRPELLMGCPRLDAGAMPPRAGNVSMVSERLTAALGYKPHDPWPLHEEFVPTHRQWHYERPPGEAGSPELLAELLCRNPRRQTEVTTPSHDYR